jgi:hypothetical protein
MNWATRPAEDFVQAVKLALKIGALQIARELALTGSKHFPEDEELKKAARILAPPKIKVTSGTGNLSWRANRTWLKEHWNEYSGKWVALLDGRLLGVANTFDALVEEVGDLKGSGILVTIVG